LSTLLRHSGVKASPPGWRLSLTSTIVSAEVKNWRSRPFVQLETRRVLAIGNTLTCCCRCASGVQVRRGELSRPSFFGLKTRCFHRVMRTDGLEALLYITIT
jgi:hypothetical protein